MKKKIRLCQHHLLKLKCSQDHITPLVQLQERQRAFKRYIWHSRDIYDGTQRIDFDDFSMLCLFANYDLLIFEKAPLEAKWKIK